LSANEVMDVHELPENIRQFIPEKTESITLLPDEGTNLEVLVENLEIGLIKQALEKNNQSQKKSAGLLGLSPRSFRYRLKKYDLGNGNEE
jgi:transcriptional regulator with PAS, ATPase and Fis domain